MKRKKLISLMVFGFMLVACQPANETKPPLEEENESQKRIVATTVAATELANALGLDLVGIPTSYKELPDRYDDVMEIGNPMSPDMERIRSLKPDEVWSVTTLEADLEEPFNQASIHAEFLDFQSVDAMGNEIVSIGSKHGRLEEAEAIVSEFEKTIADIKGETESQEPVSVLILMGVPGSYLVATEHSYIGDLVQLAGGQNVIEGEAEAEYLASNTEHLQQANPDVILRAAHGMPEEVVDMFDEEFQTNDIWKHFHAVSEGRVYDLEETLFGTTGNIAVSQALRELQAMLHPEVHP